MSQKTVYVEGIGEVVLAKRRGTRNLRLSIRADGKVRVGLPMWAPYSAGMEFVKKRRDWITSHLGDRVPLQLVDGHRIGKSYHLQITSQPIADTRTRVAANLITVSSPHHQSDPKVQMAAQKACERALKKEAENLLTMRLDQMAASHGFVYKEVRIKKLASRWGSCSEKKSITLNYFLVQLPWHLIDYVIAHELAHTRHLNHGREFWRTVENMLPSAKQRRQEIRDYRPVLTPV